MILVTSVLVVAGCRALLGRGPFLTPRRPARRMRSRPGVELAGHGRRLRRRIERDLLARIFHLVEELVTIVVVPVDELAGSRRERPHVSVAAMGLAALGLADHRIGRRRVAGGRR